MTEMWADPDRGAARGSSTMTGGGSAGGRSAGSRDGQQHWLRLRGGEDHVAARAFVRRCKGKEGRVMAGWQLGPGSGSDCRLGWRSAYCSNGASEEMWEGEGGEVAASVGNGWQQMGQQMQPACRGKDKGSGEGSVGMAPSSWIMWCRTWGCDRGG